MDEKKDADGLMWYNDLYAHIKSEHDKEGKLDWISHEIHSIDAGNLGRRATIAEICRSGVLRLGIPMEYTGILDSRHAPPWVDISLVLWTRPMHKNKVSSMKVLYKMWFGYMCVFQTLGMLRW